MSIYLFSLTIYLSCGIMDEPIIFLEFRRVLTRLFRRISDQKKVEEEYL